MDVSSLSAGGAVVNTRKKSEAPLEGFQRRWRKTHLSYETIAALHVPEGWTVEYHKSLSGWASPQRKLIKASRPTTPKSLYLFLHECGHAHLKHGQNRWKPRHVEEMEAEQWAHAIMAKHNIPVPARMTRGRNLTWRPQSIGRAAVVPRPLIRVPSRSRAMRRWCGNLVVIPPL
jgi:hypothetical protein